MSDPLDMIIDWGPPQISLAILITYLLFKISTIKFCLLFNCLKYHIHVNFKKANSHNQWNPALQSTPLDLSLNS
jgi:hypothetical protein